MVPADEFKLEPFVTPFLNEKLAMSGNDGNGPGF